MIIFNQLNSVDYRTIKSELYEKEQSIAYQNGKMYLIRTNGTRLVCNRVLQNDLTRNDFGVTRDCAILDKWGYR